MKPLILTRFPSRPTVKRCIYYIICVNTCIIHVPLPDFISIYFRTDKTAVDLATSSVRCSIIHMQ